MKTNITLSEYQFSGKNNPLFQISDDPVNKLVRVIEIQRAEYLFDIDMISLKSTTYYINPTLKVVVFTAPTKVEGKDWNICKGDMTVQIDSNLQPVSNPDFNEELEVSKDGNYPYALIDAYEQFKDISVSFNMSIMDMFINRNDTLKLFD